MAFSVSDIRFVGRRQEKFILLLFAMQGDQFKMNVNLLIYESHIIFITAQQSQAELKSVSGKFVGHSQREE